MWERECHSVSEWVGLVCEGVNDWARKWMSDVNELESMVKWTNVNNTVKFIAPKRDYVCSLTINPCQAPKVIELLVCWQPDDPTGQAQKDIAPFLILFIWTRYSYPSRAREESMSEKSSNDTPWSAILSAPDQASFHQSVESEGSDGNMFTQGECCVI